MTAELWAIPALLLVVLLIGLAALVRGRPRQPSRPPSSRLDASATRPQRPIATRPPVRHFEHSASAELDTEPENLHTRREAATEALKLARQRSAADAARLEALRQSRAHGAEQSGVVTPLRRPLPPRRPLPGPADPAQAPVAARPAALPVRPVPAVPLGSDLPRMPVAPPLSDGPGASAPAWQAPPVASPTPAPARLAAAPARGAEAAVQARPLPMPPRTLPEPPPRGVPAVPSVAAPVAVAPITVLVVDDSKVVRVKTSRLLEKHHYQVMLADDGLTALQALAGQWPDLVITDVEMPGLDGFGLTRQLRSQPRGAAMPVIMITSSNERHRDEASRAGVSVLLGKPYPEEQLLAEVEKALGRVAQPAPAGLLMQ